MGTSRPGADRIDRMQLRHQVAEATHSLHCHPMACHVCASAGSDVYAHCGAWWELARQLHTARRQLRAWDEPETTNMQPLFNLGEL